MTKRKLTGKVNGMGADRQSLHPTAARTFEEVARGLVLAAKAGWKVRDFALFMRPWLDADPITWHFPTWSVRRRPFDWAEDEADIPLPPLSPPWELPERRQFDLYLRPAAPVVQR